ncbi:MAG: DUF2846 domain-containing protein [Ideonella sp.]|nr:DUF2846 domain-containing protein [Ideonella sp.]MCC7457542.1 DUF2846 domain-containing protein [Nitrospira sp.]
MTRARSTPTRRALIAAALAVATLLGACATASGPQFSGLEAVPPGQAQLYLYRKSAIYAAGAAYDVAVDGKAAGKLFNASYLVLPLAPGERTVSVDERGFASAKTFKVAAEAGKRYFAEYDSSKGLLLGWGLLSGSSMKSEAEAIADLKDLKRAQ